ncbi:MAG: hypothetical protein K0R15_1336 [Clostridiales bacterium]|nr:hypothetical protein [Clostridiales bacterium]
MTQGIEDGIITQKDMLRAKEHITREEVARIMYAILNNTEMIKKYELTEMNEKLIFSCS